MSAVNTPSGASGSFGSQLLDAIAAARPPRNPSPLYVLSLIFTAAVMVLIPLAYVAMVVILTLLVLSWVVIGLLIALAMLSSIAKIGKVGILLALAVYLGPLFCGTIVVICMVKPLFAPQRKREPRPSLKETDEPLLFAAIHAMADAIGAPRPNAVELDCSVNAAAGFRRGLRSVFSAGDMTLVIGMPLVRAMDVSQFLGVVAHEFGHFAQGGAMRATYLITGVNAWIYRAVYDRDAVDEWLERKCEQTEGVMVVAFLVARLSVWSSRRVLWLLMAFGHLVSMFMTRQMEYDADRYNAYFLGTKRFTELSYRVEKLVICQSTAMQTLADSADAGRVVDDMPAFIAWRETLIDSKMHKEVEDALRTQGTGLFDTHPSTFARIKAAETHQFPGVLHFDQPATALFRRADFFSAAATRTWYRDTLGDKLDAIKVVPTAEFIGKDKSHRVRADAIRRFIGAEPGVMRLPSLGGVSDTQAPADARAAGAAILESRKTVFATAAKARSTHERINAWQKGTLDLVASTAVKEADLVAFGSDLPAVASVEDGRRQVRDRDAQEKRLVAELSPYDSALRRRVHACLWLLAQPTMAKRLPDAATLHARALVLLDAAAALCDSRVTHDRLTRHLVEFLGIVKTFGRLDASSEKAQQAIRRVEKSIRDAIHDLERQLAMVDYPFSEDGEHKTVIDAVRAGGAATTTRDLGELVDLAGKFMERVGDVHAMVFAELVEILEKAEQAVGFKALFPDADGIKHADSTADSHVIPVRLGTLTTQPTVGTEDDLEILDQAPATKAAPTPARSPASATRPLSSTYANPSIELEPEPAPIEVKRPAPVKQATAPATSKPLAGAPATKPALAKPSTSTGPVAKPASSPSTKPTSPPAPKKPAVLDDDEKLPMI